MSVQLFALLLRAVGGLTAGRIVTLLTPLVFAPLAGFITLEVSKIGIVLPEGDALKTIIEAATFLVGALIAYLKSAQWLKGYRESEALHEKSALGVPDQEVTVTTDDALDADVIDPDLTEEEAAALADEAGAPRTIA